MNKVYSLKVNNKYLEYVKEDDDNYLLYNTYNNRTIRANYEVINYLQNNYVIGHDSPLYNFIESKKPFNILDFDFFKITISNSTINKLSTFTKLTNNNIVIILSLLAILLFVSLSNNLFKISFSELQNIWAIIIYIYLIQLIITFFHEMSHFYYYQNEFETRVTNFGVTLRYLTLILFFTSVPFMKFMSKKSKINLITAGIKTQITIAGLLSIIGLLYTGAASNIFFKLLFYYNSLMIITNIVPFFRLDGFWLMSTLLNTENYMKYYNEMLIRKKEFNIMIFIFGSLNILLIICLMFFSFYNTYLLVKSYI